MVKMNRLQEFVEDIAAFCKGQPYFGWEKPATDGLLSVDQQMFADSCDKPPKRTDIKTLPNGGWVETNEAGKKIVHKPQPTFVKTL